MSKPLHLVEQLGLGVDVGTNIFVERIVEFLETLRQAYPDVQIDYFQSNHEGDLVDMIQEAYGIFDAIVINPAAYTHTSIAILDALKAVSIPAVEVHLSDISEREQFRQVSYAGLACIKTFKGLGFEGYRKAIEFLKEYLSQGV